MLASSLGRFRARFHRLFFTLHVISIPCLLALLALHYLGDQLVLWCALPVLYLVADIASRRILFKRSVAVKKFAIIGSGEGEVLKLECECPSNFFWNAGQHVLLQCPKLSQFEWHPFTVAGGSRSSLTFYISVRKNWTERLLRELEAGKVGFFFKNRGDIPSHSMHQWSGEHVGNGRSVRIAVTAHR